MLSFQSILIIFTKKIISRNLKIGFLSNSYIIRKQLKKNATKAMFFKKNLNKFTFFSTIIVLILLNLASSILIRNSNLFFIANTKPFSLNIGIILASLLVIVLTYGFIKLKFHINYPSATILVLSGSWSNLIERLFFSNVSDYIPFIYSYINLADIQIWTGLIIINYYVWFKRTNNFE